MKKILRIILIAIPVFLVIAWLVIYIGRNTKTTLPAPTGKYSVGRTTYEWIDTTRIDSLAPKPTPRELFVWVWYPTVKTESDNISEYLPEAWREAIATRQGLLARFFTRKLTKIQPHSLEEAKMLLSENRFPVVLIKSGIGSLVTDFTTIAEDLASHGYVVVGSDSPYSSSVVVFSDGRVINDNTKGNPTNIASRVDRNRRLDRLVSIWTDDTRFILDKLEQLDSGDSTNQLYRRLDLKNVGVFGQSLGGSAAFRFTFDDKRCKAGASINGIPFGNITDVSKPFMFLMADEKDSASNQMLSGINRIYKHLPKGRVWITLKGTKHNNFSDQSLIREKFLARRSGDIGSINRRLALQITSSSLRTFFDINLKKIPSSNFQELAKQYPEIILKQ